MQTLEDIVVQVQLVSRPCTELLPYRLRFLVYDSAVRTRIRWNSGGDIYLLSLRIVLNSSAPINVNNFYSDIDETLYKRKVYMLLKKSYGTKSVPEFRLCEKTHKN
jgi:hypothetical protein